MERTSLIESIVLEIRDKIIAGELKDGDMLPSQDAMARNLGVSRASLREALNRLASAGLIVTKHGTGTFVKMTSVEDVINSLSSLLVMDKASAVELLQARLYIEPGVAGLAAENADEENIEKIRFQLEGMERDFDQGKLDTFISKDVQFHIYISAASGNRVLAKVLEIIRGLLHKFISKYFENEPSSVLTAIEYHRKILEAIAEHDPKKSRRHMEGHIISLLRGIKQQDTGW